MGRTKGKQETLDPATAKRLKTRLYQARIMQNKTLGKIAEVAGCSQSFLSKIESGRSYPSIPTLVRLANALGITMGWLFEDHDDDEPPVSRRDSPRKTYPAL